MATHTVFAPLCWWIRPCNCVWKKWKQHCVVRNGHKPTFVGRLHW